MTETTGSEDLPKERVTIFDKPGESWERDFGHRESSGSPLGYIVLGAGMLLLLNTLNIIPWTVWDHVWRFWPVVFILWGIQIVAGSGRIGRFLVSIITICTVVLIGLFAVEEVRPELVRGLPPEIQQILRNMKGVGL